MELKFTRDMVFLLNLYRIGEGSLDDISKVTGVKVGHIYQFKKELEKRGIIELDKFVRVKMKHRHSHQKIWRINHNKLDEFLLEDPLIKLWVDRFD